MGEHKHVFHQSCGISSFFPPPSHRRTICVKTLKGLLILIDQGCFSVPFGLKCPSSVHACVCELTRPFCLPFCLSVAVWIKCL